MRISGAIAPFIPAICISKSKSVELRKPRTMIVAPAARAASIARPEKATTSSAQLVSASAGRAASRISDSRSSTENSAALLGLAPTPIVSLSQNAAAPTMTSRWPLVIGSNDPE